MQTRRQNCHRESLHQRCSSARDGHIGMVTQAFDPITRWLGWRTDLKLKPFIETAKLKVEKIYKLNKTSLYTVLLLRKENRTFSPMREL